MARSRPARGIEKREQQLIAKAVDLAERQLEEGTASAQVITHYLKLGTTREQLEKEKLRKENELLRAKTESIDASRRDDDFYEKVMSAIQRYSGNFFGMGEEEEDIDEEDSLCLIWTLFIFEISLII